MFPGLYTLCLATTNLADMRRFYETLGMRVHSDRGGSVLLSNGNVELALMTFLSEHCLNFRGADPFELHREMTGRGLDLSGRPTTYQKETSQADADGTSWLTRDPDSNVIFFDTNELEVGPAGADLALQRVLDSAAKQLVNVGAPDACQTAFRSRVLDVFMPSDRRTGTAQQLDTSPLTEPGTYPGHFVLCVKAADTQASRPFYEAMGLDVIGNNDEKWVEMGNGDCELALMSFLGQNWLNFRGGDPFEIHARLGDAGFVLEGEPARYDKEEYGSPGAHWQTKDPDGNVVYFDTTDPELIVPADPTALTTVLEQTLRRLHNIGTDADSVAAFREVLEPFASAPAAGGATTD
jgi:catechol 2,3-dioxygenase-like lactoylglutathione lyase family enzyme